MATTNNMSNINPLINRQMIDTNNKQVIQKNPNNNQVQPQPSADKVEISKNAQLVNNAMVALNALPEIRPNVVNTAVIQRVQNEQRIPAPVLAAKMLLEGK